MVIDLSIYKAYGEIAEYTTFHQHLEDVAHDYPDTPIEEAVEVAAWRSLHLCESARY